MVNLLRHIFHLFSLEGWRWYIKCYYQSSTLKTQSLLLAEKILNASAYFKCNGRVTYCNNLSSALAPVDKIYSKQLHLKVCLCFYKASILWSLHVLELLFTCPVAITSRRWQKSLDRESNTFKPLEKRLISFRSCLQIWQPAHEI